ncbi:MAG: ABC transporter permease [Proteobacteria bacterium]|nr:ABC transporter permease [Pseudomonadota bacterium]
MRNPYAMGGLALILFWVLVAAAAPLLAPFDPNAVMTPFQKPGALVQGSESARYWLGTDQLGRDVLSRVIWGSRTILLYAPLATLLAYAVGIAMGLVAGFHRGWTDTIFSLFSNIVLSFPVMILYVLIIAKFGPSGINILLAVVFVSAPGIMRIVRGLVLDLREQDYVSAARLRGENALYIMIVEILPNASGPLIVDGCLRVGYVAITIGMLGFLGLGLPPPNPDWGGMVADSRAVAVAFPHMVIFPCIAIASFVLGFNLLADGLRRAGLDGGS